MAAATWPQLRGGEYLVRAPHHPPCHPPSNVARLFMPYCLQTPYYIPAWAQGQYAAWAIARCARVTFDSIGLFRGPRCGPAVGAAQSSLQSFNTPPRGLVSRLHVCACARVGAPAALARVARASTLSYDHTAHARLWRVTLAVLGDVLDTAAMPNPSLCVRRVCATTDVDGARANGTAAGSDGSDVPGGSGSGSGATDAARANARAGVDPKTAHAAGASTSRPPCPCLSCRVQQQSRL